MRPIFRILMGLVVLVSPLLATPGFAQRISYDVRPGQALDRIETYTFRESPRATTNTTTYDSPLIDERLRAAVAAQLDRRGWRRDDQNPDAIVIVRRSYRTEYSFYGGYGWPAASWGFGYRPYYGIGWGGWGPVYQEEIIMGTLAIDVESADGELLWRGVGEKHVHERSKPEKRDKRVTKQVAKIFEQFPQAR
jgi:uncharacterized protein DUF4136